MEWSMHCLSGTISLKTTNSPSPSCHQFPVAPQLVGGTLRAPPFAQAVILAGVVLCVQPQLLCAHMLDSPVVSGKSCFAVNVHHVWLLVSFCSLFLDGIILIHNQDLYWNLLNESRSRIKLRSKEKVNVVLMLLVHAL